MLLDISREEWVNCDTCAVGATEISVAAGFASVNGSVEESVADVSCTISCSPLELPFNLVKFLLDFAGGAGSAVGAGSSSSCACPDPLFPVSTDKAIGSII